MHLSKAIAKSGKRIIKAIKKLSPQARLANKLQYERQSSARNGPTISASWWSLDTAKGLDALAAYADDYECRCCCCRFAYDENLRNENLENENLRNDNIENEMLRC